MPDVDYGSTFTPVFRLDSNHRELAVAVKCDLEFLKLDYYTALLNADIVAVVYGKTTSERESYDIRNRVTTTYKYVRPLPDLD